MVTPTPPLARIHAFLITKYKYSFVGGVGSDFWVTCIFLVNLLSEITTTMIEQLLFLILLSANRFYLKSTIQ